MSAAFERARSLESLGLEHGFGTAHTPAAVERLVTVRQVHGNRVLCVPPVTDGAEADALLAREPGVAVGVFTADCVPVLIADRQGRGVMAVHAGWRGTAARVCIAAVRELCAQVGCAPQSLMAAIGPCIGPCCYEVDRPVYGAFDDHAAFTSGRAGHWTLDLGLANRRQLASAGIPGEAIERVGSCTACTPGAYASYRRDGTGQRMLHWIRVPAAREMRSRSADERMLGDTPNASARRGERMARLDPLPPERMSAEQRSAYDRIVSSRSRPTPNEAVYSGLRPTPGARLGGPFEPWLRNPVLAEQLVAVGGTLRFGTTLPARLTELAILTVGRSWSAQFEFWAHERFARRAGVPGAVIDAIKARKRPAFDEPADEAVYDFASEMISAHRVGDATYARVRNELGERGVVELAVLLGYYSLVSLTLNAFEVPLPEGVEPPLRD